MKPLSRSDDFNADVRREWLYLQRFGEALADRFIDDVEQTSIFWAATRAWGIQAVTGILALRACASGLSPNLLVTGSSSIGTGPIALIYSA